MPSYGYQNELALAQAFKDLITHVTGGYSRGSAPEFTYLLTRKQYDAVRRICSVHAWPIVNCVGIPIDYNAVYHPLQTRALKNACTPAEVYQILTKAYGPRSVVRTNRDRNQQAIILNARQRVTIRGGSYYGMAIVEVKSDGTRNYLAPVTAYHATEAKKRAIESS